MQVQLFGEHQGFDRLSHLHKQYEQSKETNSGLLKVNQTPLVVGKCPKMNV